MKGERDNTVCVVEGRDRQQVTSLSAGKGSASVERGGNTFNGLADFRTKNGSSQSQTVWFIPNSMCSGPEAGSYFRLIDSCITQLNAQGLSRNCDTNQKREKNSRGDPRQSLRRGRKRSFSSQRSFLKKVESVS